MDAPLMRNGCRRVLTACQRTLSSRGWIHAAGNRRDLATDSQEHVRAAAPLQFNSDRNQFRRSERRDDNGQDAILSQIRVVPASPSYFTATPTYTDDFLKLSLLVRKYRHLPLRPGGEARVAWRTFEQYVVEVNEPVRRGRFERLMTLVQRLNNIHGSLMPIEVAEALQKFKRVVQPLVNKRKVVLPDRWGRTRGVGQRKSSSAECLVIEGDGEVIVNGRKLTDYFGRLHDRESALWALKATQRAGKYNVWVRTTGGGTTGQAEAVQLGIARALMAQEPALRGVLKKAGVLRRDPRTVERKKPGKLKARKMPAWVKR